MKKSLTSIYVPTELIAELDTVVDGVWTPSRTAALRQAIRFFLNNREVITHTAKPS